MPSIMIVLPGLAVGGSERVVSMLANRWAARGWTVTVASFEGQSTASYYSYDAAVRLVRLSTPVERRWLPIATLAVVRRVIALRRLVKRAKPDLVVSFLTRTNVMVLLSTLGMRVPVIVSERNNPSLQHVGPLWRRLRLRLYPRAFGLVTMTEGAMRYFQARMAVRGWVIPNAVQLPPIDRSPAPHLRLVAAGRLVPQKGFDLLLEAFAAIARQFPEWRLTIWGEGPERDSLERQRDRLGLAGRVELPGVSPLPGGWVASADAFVLSSRFEGWGIVLLEAMAAGLPVISFDCEWGPAEMITPGENGILVPVGDAQALSRALALVMCDPELRDRLGRAAAALGGNFAPERICELWDEVVAAAIATASDPVLPHQGEGCALA